MNDLIKNLVQKADINEETANKVIDVVKNFLDDKLPSPIDKQVVKMLDNLDDSAVEGAIDSLKKLF